ncbi:MAG: hypothetical protein Q9224_005720, partial [Gallowayella concinna]
MPSLLKRALSVRRGRQTSMTTQNTHDPTSDLKDDLPPPHSGPSSSEKETDDDEVCIDEATAGDLRVDICPHQCIYFQGLQKLIEYPDFKLAPFDIVPALTEDIGPQHEILEEESPICVCLVDPTDKGEWPSYGLSMFQYAGYNETFPGPHRGVLLKTHWFFPRETFPKDVNTTHDVERIFDTYPPLNLCPHKSLQSFATPQRILTAIQSSEPETDAAVNQKLMKSLEIYEQCKHCHSSFNFKLNADRTFVVSTIRLLGRGKSIKDPIWLS